jgi:hypothetical protein
MRRSTICKSVGSLGCIRQPDACYSNIRPAGRQRPLALSSGPPRNRQNRRGLAAFGNKFGNKPPRTRWCYRWRWRWTNRFCAAPNACGCGERDRHQNVAAQLIAGGVGGAVTTVVVGMIKNLAAKSKRRSGSCMLGDANKKPRDRYRGFTFRPGVHSGSLARNRRQQPLNKTNAFKRYGPGSARAVSQILLPNVYSASRCELDRRRIDCALLGVWASLPMDGVPRACDLMRR